MAQVEFGGLYGSVNDGEGTPLPGVTVTLAGPGASQLQVSDGLGKFRFPRLDPGGYSLKAELDGFSPLEQPNIDIRAGRTTTLPPLQILAAIKDTITVTSETPLLDERKLAQGTLISRADLERVPTAGDPWALLNQAPGVLVDQIDVGGSDNQQGRYSAPGVDAGQNDWLIDGVQITDMKVNGASPTYFDMGEFDQVELSTGGNDLSKATAGVSINMVTKRGTNEIRGSARYLITDEDLFWFFKQSSPDVDPDDFPPGQGTDIRATQIDRIENYGFDLGGPLLRDRLWLWGSAGRNDYSATLVSGFPEANHIENVAFKLNAQLSKANSLLASWNRGDKLQSNRGLDATVSWEAAVETEGPTTVTKIEDTHIFSSQLFLTGTWAEVDGGFSIIANGCIAAGSCEEAKEYLWDANGIEQNSWWSGETVLPSSEWKIDGSYFFGTGPISHELAFGGRRREFESSGSFHWPGGRDIGHLAGEVLGLPDGQGLFFAQRGEGPPVTQDYISLWVQDTLTSGKWTVNAGLRYDLQRGENPPFDVPANPALSEFLPAVEFEGNDGGGFDWESVSPRVGVTYALGEERQTLLRASFSRFASALGWEHIARVNPVNAVWGNFFFADTNGNDMWDGREEEFWFCCADGYDPADPTDLSTPNRTDPGLDPELTDELVLGVEHALRPELVVGASITWRNTSGILEERAFLRELDAGGERLARREDYVFFRDIEVTQPDGQPYTVDYYTLDPTQFVFTGGTLLLNGDREVNYLGASLTLTKRLTNQWMLRGFVNYGKPEWDIPESFFAFDDPTDARLQDLRGADYDGDLFAQPAGWWPLNLILHSTWSFNVNGMVQIAPERPWGFNVSGNLYGRQGYPIPLYSRTFTPDVGPKDARAMAAADDFRYDDVYTVDLRLEKEFHAWGRSSITLSADVFNALNAGTVLQRQPHQGLPVSNYVLETLSPRIWRLGARFNWR
jgi:hypothetical protein